MIVAVVVLASLVYIAHAAGRSPFPLWTVAVAAAAVLVALIPFAAAGHVGLLGVGTNDDMSEHLLAAWALQGHAPINSGSLIGSGYPIGPHAIAAAISTATGISLERAFTGLIVAVPALLALAAAAAIPGASRVGRSIVAVAVGLCYLQAAFLVQASFKETTESLILVASVAALYQAGRGQNGRRLRLVPLAVLGAGSVYVNSNNSAAQLLVTWAYRWVTNLQAGVISQLTVVLSIALGAAFLGERPTPVQLLGSALTLAGVVGVVWRQAAPPHG